MIEKRSIPRRKPNAVIKVLDEVTGSDLGQLANLTPEGLMLVSRTPIPFGSIFQLRLRVPSPDSGADGICFGAENVWASQAEDAGGYFWSGFSIIDISGETISVIEHLIEGWTVDNE
jgi:hypothetical protein